MGLAALGCDTGGLLVVEGSGSTGAEVLPSLPEVTPANELVSGGTFAKNAEYKLFYTVGQPTPNQNVATSTDQKLKGGLAGAVHPE